MSRQVIIDKLTVRLSKGWRGDATLLARRVAEQIQRQVAELQSTERLDLRLQGPFGGDARRVARQIGGQLKTMGEGGSRRRPK
jgi:hypothetical protein